MGAYAGAGGNNDVNASNEAALERWVRQAIVLRL